MATKKTAAKPNPFAKLAEAKEAADETVVEVDEQEAAAGVEESAQPEAAEEAEATEAPEKAAEVPAKSTRRTAKQVEQEAAEREAALQAQIDELKAAMVKKADSVDVELAVIKDRVVLEDGEGGALRVVGDGRTLTNDSWRATVDGLRLIIGRASNQATQQFQIPVSLASALGEVLTNVSEIAD